jgi:sugar O-acyltransferase (sialic acid O-acetyltransferase NeuD family)
MADLVIFGAGDIARLAHFYFTRDSEHRVVAFTVDAAHRTQATLAGLPIVDFEAVERDFPAAQCQMFVALSYAQMNRLRARKYGEARSRGYALVSYVSSRCTNLADTPIGDNCFILEDNTIQPFVRIGSNVTLWSGNHIGHDSTVEDHVFISSHVVVSGHVTVGEGSFLGVNATLRNGITIGAHTVVGGGAVIMADTAAGSVHVARPAQKIDKRSDDITL